MLLYTDCGTGLQRTDNNMEFTSWPQVNMINQKNYYTYVQCHLFCILRAFPFITLPPILCYLQMEWRINAFAKNGPDINKFPIHSSHSIQEGQLHASSITTFHHRNQVEQAN